MSAHEQFAFKSLDELRHRIAELDVNLRLADDVSALSRPVRVGHLLAPNAIAVLPMEGCDSERDGSPSDLLRRRYLRFASGGAGLLWWEANAVVEEGRANPLQMMLTDQNAKQFAALLDETNRAAAQSMGSDHRPINILQLTHSGRYSSSPAHTPAPLIPQHDPILDPRVGLGPDDPVVSDEYLDSLLEKYVKSALLAKTVGFDGVDIKACHRYLLNELLASHTREGKYGGSFENRSRLLLDIIGAVREAVGPDFIVASRFNVFDAHPYPYGFGSARDDMWTFDETEPLRLVELMIERGANLLSNSGGNPYYIYPQVTRPFDVSSTGIPIPEEHQLESIERLFSFTKKIQEAAGDIPVVGNGYSWLRQFQGYAGAANIEDGNCAFMGLGRSSFAYPDAPKDLLTRGEMDPKKVCIACSKCTQIMRDHGRTGCVVRDAKIYAPLYKQYRAEAVERAAQALL